MRGRAAPVTVVVVTDTSCRLPADLRERLQLGVRLVAHDWVHVGERMRDCRAYRLERLATAR